MRVLARPKVVFEVIFVAHVIFKAILLVMIGQKYYPSQVYHSLSRISPILAPHPFLPGLYFVM